MINWLLGMVIATFIAGPAGLFGYLATTVVIVAVIVTIAALPWINDKLLRML